MPKERIGRWIFQTACTVSTVWILAGCATRRADFYQLNKIDTHVHLDTDKTVFVETARSHNVRLLTLNTDVPDYPPVAEQQRLALQMKSQFSGWVEYATSFTMEGWDGPGWTDRTLAYLDDSFARGAVAVKVWKNIGIEFKDKDGRFVMIDDPRFDRVFAHLERRGIPLVGHLGEPKNCWLPLEQMTVNNDRDYFRKHPEYHMFLHPEYPRYEEIIRARDRMLEKHPALKFVGAHLGSLEWNVDTLAACLDRFPNMAVDLAGRMPPLQHQTVENRERVRRFFIKCQDRILYATDLAADGTENPEEVKAHLHRKWLQDWKYLATDSSMTVSEVNGTFRGLKLPVNVLEKVYYQNAKKRFNGF